MQPCLFSSLFYGDVKSKLKDMLPELLDAFKEQFSNTDEIDKILEDESKTSKISDFFEYLKESMFATLLLSVFESIDLSEVLTINPQEFMDDPSKLQEHPIVGKIQAQIQTIMKNKIEKGEFTKERIMNEFEVFKQKIQVNTEKVQILEPIKDDRVFVLFLPLNEIHEIGLMYLNYEVLLQGYRCIYLGENIPIDSLKDISSFFNNITYVAYLTVQPLQENIDEYIAEFENEILKDNNDELYLIGRMTQFINREKLPKRMSIYQSIEELTKKIQ